jgi:integrase/recombinase XerD
MKNMNTMQKELKIRGYSKATAKSYEFHNKAFLKLLNKSPRQVTKNDIKYYIESLIDSGYERATINLAISALKFYYGEILNRKFNIKRLRTQRKLHDTLSQNELNKMFENITNEKHKFLLMTLYYTGIRVSEIVNLKVKDIDFERKQVHVRCGKGRKDRFVTIRNELGVLKEYISKRNSEDYLFCGRKGKYSVRSVQKICKEYSKFSGVIKNVTPHTFRRTYATHHIENNIDIGIIQHQMGHKDRRTTSNYVNYAAIEF